MPAPKDNEFWKLRRPKDQKQIFTSPSALETAACEYFEWCDKNPLFTQHIKGKDLQLVELQKPRPYTEAGLCSYIGCSRIGWYKQLNALRTKPDSSSQELLAVMDWIEAIIFDQKYCGAVSGTMNPSVIARDLNL